MVEGNTEVTEFPSGTKPSEGRRVLEELSVRSVGGDYFYLDGGLVPAEDSGKGLEGRRVETVVYLEFLEEGVAGLVKSVSFVWTVCRSVRRRRKLAIELV